MFSAIGASVTSMFTAITVLFGAAEKGAKAIDHLAEWSEETAGAFADAARVKRAKDLKALQAE